MFDFQGYRVSSSTHQMRHQSRRNIALGNHLARLTFTRFLNQFDWILNLSYKTPVQRDLPQTMIIFAPNFTFTFTSLQKDLLHSLPLSMVVLSAVYTGGSDIMIRLALIDSKSPKCRPPCTCLTPSCGTSKRGVPVKILQNQD